MLSKRRELVVRLDLAGRGTHKPLDVTDDRDYLSGDRLADAESLRLEQTV